MAYLSGQYLFLISFLFMWFPVVPLLCCGVNFTRENTAVLVSALLLLLLRNTFHCKTSNSDFRMFQYNYIGGITVYVPSSLKLLGNLLQLSLAFSFHFLSYQLYNLLTRLLLYFSSPYFRKLLPTHLT